MCSPNQPRPATAGYTIASEVRADGLIGPELVAELAAAAKVAPLVHPLDAAPEPGYVPSKALADFVRCRDLTCRWPGCEHPAFDCDIDHTVPHRDGGATHASNLKCYCRTHHLVKTFWGWRDRQLPDGTIILDSPSGKTYVDHPGQRPAVPQPVRAHRRSAVAETHCAGRPLRRADRDDAPTPPHPGTRPRPPDQHRTTTKPPGPHDPPARPPQLLQSRPRPTRQRQ